MQFFYIILHSQFTICGFTRHAMCGYTLIHIYLYTPTFHSAIYVIMHHGAWLYVYFYIKGAVLRTAALTLHHVVTRMVIPLHVWLYIKHMVIHIYLYSDIPLYRMRLYTWLCITVYSYTRNFAYMAYVYTRHIHVCHRSIHSLSIPTSFFMSHHRLLKVR